MLFVIKSMCEAEDDVQIDITSIVNRFFINQTKKHTQKLRVALCNVKMRNTLKSPINVLPADI